MRAAALALVMLAGTVARGDEPSAAALFKRGVQALRAQDFAAASAAFQQSYTLSPKAATMCNLALTYDRWGAHLAEAVEAYRKCAEDDDAGRFRDHALVRARELRGELAAATKPQPSTVAPSGESPRPEASPPPSSPPEAVAPPSAPSRAAPSSSPPPSSTSPPGTPPSSPPPSSTPPLAAAPPVVAHAAPPTPSAPASEARPFFKDPAATSLIALGVAGIGAGVGLAVAGKLEDDNVARTVDLGNKASLYDRAGVLQPAGYVTLAVGAALLIAGVVEWAVHGRHVAAPARATRAGWSF